MSTANSGTANKLNPDYRVPLCPISSRQIYMNKIDLLRYYKCLNGAPQFEGKQELLAIFERDLKQILFEIALEQDYLK